MLALPTHDSAGPSTACALTQFEVDTIDLFVRVAHLFGISKSIGEIYGLLFVSPAPVPFEYVREKLHMSSGSASQGLRLLRSVGAVSAIYVAGDRRDHYLAETGLCKLTAGFAREKIASNLLAYEERLERLSNLISDVPSHKRSVIEERLHVLHRWREQARAILPMIMQVLETERTPTIEGVNGR